SFVGEAVTPGSLLHTDGWISYDRLEKHGYGHRITFVKGRKGSATDPLPRVHRVVSLLKRWLQGTHQGAVNRAHLDYYLDEFTFRFNRRVATSRQALLSLSAAGGRGRPGAVPVDRQKHPSTV